MLVKWSLSSGVNSGVVELEDQATDAEIEEKIREEVAQHISWSKQEGSSGCSEDPIVCLSELKYMYYMIHMMAYTFKQWMESVETTQHQQTIVSYMLKHWEREARFALKTVYPALLDTLQFSTENDFDVQAVVDKAIEFTEALSSHLPKAVIEWVHEAEEKQNIAFYQVCGYGDWYEVKLPKVVEILFQRFCRVIGAHTKSEQISEGSYGIALYNLSDEMIIVPTLKEATAILEQYDCSPYSLMSFHQGNWVLA